MQFFFLAFNRAKQYFQEKQNEAGRTGINK
jgi:hypothetical protein